MVGKEREKKIIKIDLNKKKKSDFNQINLIFWIFFLKNQKQKNHQPCFQPCLMLKCSDVTSILKVG